MSWPDWSTRPEPVSDDDAITREKAAARRSQRARTLAEIRLRRAAYQRVAPDEARHTGTDYGLHHQAPGYADPLDILADQLFDSGERQEQAYEQQQAERARWEAEEARAWLDAHRPVNRGPW